MILNFNVKFHSSFAPMRSTYINVMLHHQDLWFYLLCDSVQSSFFWYSTAALARRQVGQQ